jgi:hypothetical protein
MIFIPVYIFKRGGSTILPWIIDNVPEKSYTMVDFNDVLYNGIWIDEFYATIFKLKFGQYIRKGS